MYLTTKPQNRASLLTTRFAAKPYILTTVQPPMRNILDFIINRYHWFLFIILEVICLTLLFSYNSYHRSVWVSTANTVAGTVYGMESEVSSYFSLGEINEQLTERNVQLEQQVAALYEQLKEKGIDSLNHIGIPANTYKTISAKVVSNSVDKADNLITIDKGAADGIKKDMAVVSGCGIVGIVYLVGNHYSVIIPVLSSQSSISCKLRGSEYFGYLHWEGGYCNVAYLDDVPRHADVKVNEEVITSGFSSVFPANISVGKVRKVLNSPDGVSYRLEVLLNTDFANLRDVCVIDNSNLDEQLQIMRMATDSLSQKKY